MLAQCTPDMERLAAHVVDTAKVAAVGREVGKALAKPTPFSAMLERVKGYGYRGRPFSKVDSLVVGKLYEMVMAYEAFKEAYDLPLRFEIVERGYAALYDWKRNTLKVSVERVKAYYPHVGASTIFHEMGHVGKVVGRRDVNGREIIPFIMAACYAPQNTFEDSVVKAFLSPTFPERLKDDVFLLTPLLAPFIERPAIGEAFPTYTLLDMAYVERPPAYAWVRRRVAEMLLRLAEREDWRQCSSTNCYDFLLSEISEIVYEEVRASALFRGDPLLGRSPFDTYRAIVERIVEKREEWLKALREEAN